MRYFKITLKCLLVLFLGIILFAAISDAIGYILFATISPGFRYAVFPLSLFASFCLTSWLIVVGRFCWQRWHMFRNIIFAVAVLALVLVSGICLYFRGRGVNQAEDRQRWLQEIDASNAKSGFIKDTNGNWVYVGVTNSKRRTGVLPGSK